MILEGLYKSKLKNSVQLQIVMALCMIKKVARNQGKPDCHQLKTSVTLHTDQIMRTRNFRFGKMLWKEDQLPRVKKETEPMLRGKWKSVFCGRHMDNVPKETHGRKGRSGQTSSKGSGSKQESSVDKCEIPCRFNFCWIPSCKFWHPSVCLNYKSGKRLCTWQQMSFPTCWGRRKAWRCKRISCHTEGIYPIGLCISRFLSENSILCEFGKLGTKHTVKFPTGTWHQTKIR